MARHLWGRPRLLDDLVELALAARRLGVERVYQSPRCRVRVHVQAALQCVELVQALQLALVYDRVHGAVIIDEEPPVGVAGLFEDLVDRPQSGDDIRCLTPFGRSRRSPGAWPTGFSSLCKREVEPDFKRASSAGEGNTSIATAGGPSPR